MDFDAHLIRVQFKDKKIERKGENESEREREWLSELKLFKVQLQKQESILPKGSQTLTGTVLYANSSTRALNNRRVKKRSE